MPKYKKIKLTLDYLHFGKISVYRTDKELDDQSDYLAMIYQKISESIATGKGLEPNVNSYCSFCQYRSNCEAFTAIATTKFKPESDVKKLQGLISKESGVVVPIEKLDLFLETVKAKIKILEKVEKDAKAFILEQVAKNGKDGSVKIGKTTYSAASKKYTTYDTRTVLEVMNEYEPSVDINTVLSPQKIALDTLFKSNPDAIDRLKKTSKPSYSESYVK
jgi:hypothetical protein